MSKLKLTYDELTEMVSKSVSIVLNEISLAPLKKKIINKLYKATNDITSHIYSDDNWAAVTNAYNILKTTVGNEGDVEMRVENGGYWKQLGEFPNYKEYLITINMNSGVQINGSLKCHSAGTMEDTFSRYDITITFW